jgi:hypothetical protein
MWKTRWQVEQGYQQLKEELVWTISRVAPGQGSTIMQCSVF